MPTITKSFIYTGTTQVIVIPAGTTSIDAYIWGGAGGGGGHDRHTPGSGSAGHYVTDTAIAMTSHISKTMKVAVGGGGAGGSSGSSAAGGTNGKSLTGYSGGVGGTSGPQGSSGAGGGGGGATVITIDGAEIAVAGGGGGGGGAGVNSGGSAGINTNSATGNSPGTLGENGAGHSGDGGAGGAGGGGTDGGKGGSGASGDNGGSGGYAGTNYIASGTQDNGSGVTPGGTGVSQYSAGVAVGGGGAATGGNGKAVVIFNIGVQAHYKVSGAWKSTNNMYTKVSGVWKEITAAYTKVSGTWKALFNAGLDFTETSAGFGDGSGGATSGSTGSGGGGGGGGGRVICTWLQLKGKFSQKDLKIDTAFSVKHLSRTTKIGYWFWALPLVEYMNKSSDNKNWFGGLVIETIKILAQARANELAYKMGKRDKGDLLGKFTRWIGEGFCWIVGVIVRPFTERKFGDWLEIYDPDIN